jgi:hypothetical protein
MYVITATFDAEQAHAHVNELLALGDSPERLAEHLGIPRDLDYVREGVAVVSFKRLVTEITRLQQFLALETKIEKLEGDKSMLRFLGSGFKEKQRAKLDGERQKFGSLLDGPRWFYQQPRVRLLSAIRDYALDSSQQGNAVWIEVDEKTLVFPIANIFEHADLAGAEALAHEIEKPLKDISSAFLLEHFEGNRSISFDLQHGTILYYTPAPGASG